MIPLVPGLDMSCVATTHAKSCTCLVGQHPKEFTTTKTKSLGPERRQPDLTGVQRLLPLITDPAQEEFSEVFLSRTLLQVAREGLGCRTVVVRDRAVRTMVAHLRKSTAAW